MSNPKVCVLCGKPLMGAQRKYCSAKCKNRAGTAGKYGLLPHEYAALTKEKVCVICNRRVRRWQLDHDHNTMLLMGPVCYACNQHILTGIRRAEDPIAAAKRLVEFLTNPPAQQFGREVKVKAAIAGRKSRYHRRRLG